VVANSIVIRSSVISTWDFARLFFLFLKKETEVNGSRSSSSHEGEMVLSSRGINSEAFNVAGMWLH
jgi:hypothetical protein